MCQFIHKKNDCSENIMKRFVSVAYGKVMAFQRRELLGIPPSLGIRRLFCAQNIWSRPNTN